MQKQPEQSVEGIEIPFAWANLNHSKRSIRLITDEMPKLRERIDKLLSVNKEKARIYYDELVKQHDKLLEVIASLRPALIEMELNTEADYSSKLHNAVKSFSVMTPDYSRFTAGLNEFLARLPGDDAEGDEEKKTNASIIGRLMNFVRMGYYPTELAQIEHIERGITFPEGITTNLLDPCCGCGIALRSLATGNNCMTYGVELDEMRAEEAQERLHRVGVGSFFHSAVSHEAFHLLFLNPPYISVIKEGGGSSRSEKMFLVDAMQNLMMEGLLVYIIPYYRITADIARILCDNFTDLSVYKFTGKEFDRFRQVAIFGLRRKKSDGSGQVETFLNTVVTADMIPELSELPQRRYPLPAIPLSVNVFKGAVFNELELQRQLRASKSIAKLMEKSALDNQEKRPLLPLNVGQIGLIAGSGMINGLAECETPHIIKGRIVKQVQRSVDESDTITTLTETHTNKMILNILTPHGFISLN